MPNHMPTGTGIRIVALLGVSACLAVRGQAPNENQFQVLLKQGFALHQQAQFSEAIPVLEQARRLEPNDYFANLLLGIDLLRTGKVKDALPRLELAARVKPGEEIPQDYLGEAHASLGQYAQAAEAYRRAMQRSHNSEESLEAWAGFALERFREIGESLRGTEAGVVTVRRLQEAATKPSTVTACPEPIPALEHNLAANPAPTDAHMQTAYRLSICYAVEAGNAAQLLQANNKDDATLHRLRGDVLLRLKQDPASAQEEYRKAIALRPGDPALLARLGEAQLGTGDTEAATQSARAALAIDPHRPEALRTLAFLAMSNREYNQALPWLRQLAAESPDDRKVQVELGRALAQTGESAEALRYLAPALDAGYPDEKGALHALKARILRDLGREEEAAKASAEARRLSDAFQARSKVSGKENADE
jgi:tetratricopeptide (TPR) repeat protein